MCKFRLPEKQTLSLLELSETSAECFWRRRAGKEAVGKEKKVEKKKSWNII